MELHVRPATADDIPELIRLLRTRPQQAKETPAERDRKERGLIMMIGPSEERILLVAEKNGDIAGMVSGQITVSVTAGGLAALLEDLVVAPAWRNEGVGSRLLAGVEGWARSLGVARLVFLCGEKERTVVGAMDKSGWLDTRYLCLRKNRDKFVF